MNAEIPKVKPTLCALVSFTVQVSEDGWERSHVCLNLEPGTTIGYMMDMARGISRVSNPQVSIIEMHQCSALVPII